MKIIITILILLASLSIQSQSTIKIRVSVKVILNSAGNRDTRATTTNIDSAFTWMNERMAEFGRGYEFVKTEELTIGGPGTNPTTLFNDVTKTISVQYLTDLENAAQASPTLYGWRSNAINFYITNSATSNGRCSFPDDSAHDEAIALNHLRMLEPEVFMHEIGHFFNLSHTAVGPPDAEGTLPIDNNSWGQDSISLMNFGVVYASLSTSNQQKVDDTFNNIMSQNRNQGEVRAVLVEEQLDRWGMAIRDYQTRRDVTSGIPYHVDDNDNTPCNLSGSSPCGCDGTPYVPFEEVDCALDAVDPNGGDVIVVKPGTQDVAAHVISQPVLMTGTRSGSAIIK